MQQRCMLSTRSAGRVAGMLDAGCCPAHSLGATRSRSLRVPAALARCAPAPSSLPGALRLSPSSSRMLRASLVVWAAAWITIDCCHAVPSWPVTVAPNGEVCARVRARACVTV